MPLHQVAASSVMSLETLSEPIHTILVFEVKYSAKTIFINAASPGNSSQFMITCKVLVTSVHTRIVAFSISILHPDKEIFL